MDKFLYMGRKITEMLMLEKRLQPGQEPGAGWPAKVSRCHNIWRRIPGRYHKCPVFHKPFRLLEKN